MTGITNRPEPEEEARQAIVEQRKQELPKEDPSAKNDHHPVGKDTSKNEAEPTPGAMGMPEQTQPGKGTQPRGH